MEVGEWIVMGVRNNGYNRITFIGDVSMIVILIYVTIVCIFY